MGYVLTCWHRFLQEWILDDRVRLYIIQSRFYAFHRVGHVQFDWPLIIALVERWHPETHTLCQLVRWPSHYRTLIMCTWSSYHWYYKYQLVCTLWGVIRCSTDRNWYSWNIPLSSFNYYQFLSLTIRGFKWGYIVAPCQSIYFIVSGWFIISR